MTKSVVRARAKVTLFQIARARVKSIKKCAAEKSAAHDKLSSLEMDEVKTMLGEISSCLKEIHKAKGRGKSQQKRKRNCMCQSLLRW